MKKYNALLIGHSYQLLLSIPGLFSRANFNIDCISTSKLIKYNKFIRNYTYVNDNKKIVELANYTNKITRYDIIILSDDGIIYHILKSDLPIQDKLSLLPVTGIKHIGHLASKIGLSEVLSKNNINTPRFTSVPHKNLMRKKAQQFGFPLFVKIDLSGGGMGVYECLNMKDIIDLENKINKYPVLMQEKIYGCTIGLSGFFINNELIHFTYSKLDKVVDNKFGPSSLRTYYQISNIDETIYDEVKKLGEVLGANGFVNITCVLSYKDKKRYYIEADVRPEAWCDMSKYFGDDLAPIINNYFETNKTLEYPHNVNINYPNEIILPYFLRLNLWDLLCNRYNVYNYITHAGVKNYFAMICFYFKIKFIILLKFILPNRLMQIIRKSKFYFKLLMNILLNNN